MPFLINGTYNPGVLTAILMFLPLMWKVISGGLGRIFATDVLFVAHVFWATVALAVPLASQIGRLRAMWLPLTVALVVSTLLGIAVTALLLQFLLRRRRESRSEAP